jgi:hypothetical protein
MNSKYLYSFNILVSVELCQLLRIEINKTILHQSFSLRKKIILTWNKASSPLTIEIFYGNYKLFLSMNIKNLA